MAHLFLRKPQDPGSNYEPGAPGGGQLCLWAVQKVLIGLMGGVGAILLRNLAVPAITRVHIEIKERVLFGVELRLRRVGTSTFRAVHRGNAGPDGCGLPG